jgi:hypothetical protein
MKLRATLLQRLQARDERGDVPGWVMITVMTIVIGKATKMQ